MSNFFATLLDIYSTASPALWANQIKLCVAKCKLIFIVKYCNVENDLCRLLFVDIAYLKYILISLIKSNRCLIRLEIPSLVFFLSFWCLPFFDE